MFPGRISRRKNETKHRHNTDDDDDIFDFDQQERKHVSLSRQQQLTGSRPRIRTIQSASPQKMKRSSPASSTTSPTRKNQVDQTDFVSDHVHEEQEEEEEEEDDPDLSSSSDWSIPYFSTTSSSKSTTSSRKAIPKNAKSVNSESTTHEENPVSNTSMNMKMTAKPPDDVSSPLSSSLLSFGSLTTSQWSSQTDRSRTMTVTNSRSSGATGNDDNNHHHHHSSQSPPIELSLLSSSQTSSATDASRPERTPTPAVVGQGVTDPIHLHRVTVHNHHDRKVRFASGRPPRPASSSTFGVLRTQESVTAVTTVKKANTTHHKLSHGRSSGESPKRNIFVGTTVSHAKSSKISPHGNLRHRKQYGDSVTTATSSQAITNNNTTTTTSDIYAIQDKGNYEMLCDECIYLCQNIMQHQNPTSRMHHPPLSRIESRITMLRTCLSTTAELAYLLSSKKNRRRLFLRPSTKHGAMEMTTTANNDPLQAVLNVFAWMASFIQDEAMMKSYSDTDQMIREHPSPPGKRRADTGRPSHYASPSDGSNISLKSHTSNNNNNNKVEVTTVSSYNAIRQQLLDALGMCMYFLSFDCTLADDSVAVTGSSASSNSSAAASRIARRIRKAVLCHDGCIRGILHLILSDPFTQKLRGTTHHNHVDREIDEPSMTVVPSSSHLSSPLPSIRNAKDSTSVTTSTIDDNIGHAFSVSDTPTSVSSSLPLLSPSLAPGNGFAVQTPDRSIESTDSVDPTLLGRLQRKRRRLEQQQQIINLNHCDDDLSYNCVDVKHAALSKDDTFISKSPSPLPKQRKNASAEDISVASSNDSVMMKARDKMDHIISQIYDCMQSTDHNGNDNDNLHLPGTSNQFSRYHSCDKSKADPVAYTIRSVVPIVALARIICGKVDGSEESCMDDDVGKDEDGETDLNDYNPILESNQMLSAGGAIPLLSQALSESLAAVSCQLAVTDCKAMDGRLDQQKNSVSSECTGCINALHDRVSALVQLIDGASLLSSSNREQFCLEGYTHEAGGYLVIALLTVLKRKLYRTNANTLEAPSLFDGVWDETILVILKMLTSLTHENMTAARELETPIVRENSVIGLLSHAEEGSFFCGVHVIAEVLQHATQQMLEAQISGSSHQDGKLLYDAIIFCLNILANFIESGGSCRIVAEMPILQRQTGMYTINGGCIRFLQWLTRWLVNETTSFREAVVESTFGSSPSKHHDRQLDAQEDEKLVIAGNGFVLLCCLLLDDDKSNDDNYGPSETAASVILNELPGTNRHLKLTYIKNTLKAFCNFYHFSIGDLSLAIVAPVKQLIQRLDSRFKEIERE